MRITKFQYCLITDRNQCRQPLHELAEQADAAKVDYFQLRDKNLEAAELLNLARHVRPLLAHAQFIINGRLDVALACGADGLHLQKDNIPIHAVRRKYPKMIIGYSAHTREELQLAEQSGADYAFLSPIFPPRSKTNGNPPVGAEALSAWITGLKIPVLALGGITAENVKELQKAGCAGVAGISLFLREGKFDSSGMVIR